MRRPTVLPLVLTAALLLPAGRAAAGGPSRAARADEGAPPASVLAARIPAADLAAVETAGRLEPPRAAASGPQQVIVHLTATPVVDAVSAGPAAREQARRGVEADQAAFLARASAAAPGSRVLGRTRVLLNAVFLEVDASRLAALAADPAVLHVHRVRDYELDLAETVPYVGAAAVQALGVDGTGVRVAVLDSGIDYLHADLGGSGNPLDFAANDPGTIEPGTFPTAKVIGGYDFVGPDWFPDGPALAPDPDPLDAGSGRGHGTHVADIIAGVGPAVGVAPGASLYAVKVCSSVSTSCSGVALMQGMEFAVDPDGDGDPADRVDVVNMSLGSPYGQPFDDDLSQAVDAATRLGVLTVASAGNSGDKPFVVGAPSAAPTALSVAQTQVPSAYLQQISVGGVDYTAVFQPWSVAPAGVVAGPLQYADGGGGNLLGCDPFVPGSLAGKVVLVDRGTCNISLKVSNAGDAGAVACIVGMVTPDEPFEASMGAGSPAIPGYMIGQAEATAIKAAIPATATIDPAARIPLAGQMVSTSSRGPMFQRYTIKPEIGAPGASVSAVAGSGSGTAAFGGTSGAAPMVAGAAALLLQAFPDASPLEVKARLMNTAERAVDVTPFRGPAEISRIGAGELRVDRALAAPAAAWDAAHPSATLGFGQADVARKLYFFKRTVRVRNYGAAAVTYAVTPTFRFAGDEATGAVSISAPASVTVKAGRDATFDVVATVRGERLAGNWLNSGNQGANGVLLTANEFDGYLLLDDGAAPLHLPWHVLPRRAADARPKTPYLKVRADGNAPVKLANVGVATAHVDGYALIGVSPDVRGGTPGAQSPTPDLRAVGVNTFPVPAGYCGPDASFIWAFAVNVWDRPAHAVAPGSYRFDLDTDRDGVRDYAVYNADLSGGLTDGRNITWAGRYDAAGQDVVAAVAFFYAEHATTSANTVLFVCGEQVGLSGVDLLATNVDVLGVYADDTYFGGPGDAMGPFTITPLGERFVPIPFDVSGGTTGTFPVHDFGAFPGNTPELGVLIVTNGDRGTGDHGGATRETEGLVIPAKGSFREVWRTTRIP